MATPERALSVIGVPSSVGSHNAGQELAPEAWRTCGLVDRLRADGHDVQDAGSLPVRRHEPSPRVDGVRALRPVVEVARATAAAVAGVAAEGRVPLVLGGDCTITLGVVAGLTRSSPAGLLYVDGDADLNTPDRSDSGILDTMGMTHLLGGGTNLARIGDRTSLLDDQDVELFGFDPAELDQHQWTELVGRRLSATPAPVVREDPATAIRAAWERLTRRHQRVIVHLDVDVLDTGAFPLANFPHFNGLTLDELAACLRCVLPAPELAALVVTEVNPTHDPGLELTSALRDVLCDALLAPAGS